VNLTPDNMGILNAAKDDYFWNVIPFARLTTALDVGAHVGIWSHLCQQQAPHIQITAIEPHADNYAALVDHCLPIETVNGWVGYRDNAVGLCCREQMSGSHYVLHTGESPVANSEIIPLPQRYTLEDFAPFDLLKLDCEGSEFDILLNCTPATLHRIQVIVGEYHLDFGSFSTIATRLTAFGFELTINPQPIAQHLGHFLAMKGSL
jgi:FkbM family methyltransferase